MKSLSRMFIVLGAYLGSNCAMGSPAMRPADRTDLIWNVFPDLSTRKANKVGIFRDARFGADTTCTLSYNPSDRTKTFTRVPLALDGKQLFKDMPWAIINWHWRNSGRDIFEQDLPNLCSDHTEVRWSEKNLELSADFQGSMAELLTIGPDYIRIKLDSAPYYEKLFGSKFFPATNTVTWPLLLIQHTFRFRSISKYSSLYLTFKAVLQKATVDENPIISSAGAPAGASLSYNPAVNATRFEFSLPLRWHPQVCVEGSSSAQSICKKYFNKPINLLTFIYDNRWEYWTGTPITTDPGTANFGNVYIYRLGMRGWIPGMPAKNPFKVVGRLAIAQADILATLKNVILSARQQADRDRLDGVPPRMRINGQLETDDQYVDDFAVNSFSLGYENSGLSDLSYEVRAFSLVGTLK